MITTVTSTLGHVGIHTLPTQIRFLKAFRCLKRAGDCDGIELVSSPATTEYEAGHDVGHPLGRLFVSSRRGAYLSITDPAAGR